MNKRLLKWILIGAFSTLLMGAAVSCKDYSSDIENLQEQITALSGNVDYLQSLINAGKVVTNVTQNGEGVTISFSDGSTYTIYNGQDGADGKDGVDGQDGADGKDGVDGKDGADGKDGNDGKDADVWTIGTDGYWYLNGTKTDYKAVGTDGTTPTITIGDNGDWYIDGEDTGVSAKGEKGDPGENGTNGSNGVDGKSYVLIPCDGHDAATADDDEEDGDDNTEDTTTPEYDGWFCLYEVTYDEDADTYSYTETQHHYYQYVTEDSTNIIALWDGNWLTLFNVQNTDGELTTATIFLGNELNSIAFVPSYLDSDTYYPTTAPFIGITTYYAEKEVDSDGYFEAQTATVVSASTKLVYRLNPTNAYVENAHYDFITRNVKVRSSVSGDSESLFTIIANEDGDQATHEGETLTFNVTLTGDLSDEGYDITALRVTTGSNPDGIVTSDYIRVKGAEEVEPVLVDPENPTDEDDELVAGYYPRTKGINENQTEDSEFIHYFIDNNTISSTSTGTVADDDPDDSGTTTDPDNGTGSDGEGTGSDNGENVDEGTGTDNGESSEGTDTDETVKTIADYVCCTFKYNSSQNIEELVDLYVETDGEAVALSTLIDESCISYEVTYPSEFYVEGEDQQQYAHLITNEDGTHKIDVAGDSPVSVGHYPVVRVDAYVNGYLVGSTYILFEIVNDPIPDAYIKLDESWLNYRAITGHANGTAAQNADKIEVHHNWTLAEFVEQVGAASGLNTDEDNPVIKSLDDIWTYYNQSSYNSALYAMDTGSRTTHIGESSTVYETVDSYTGENDNTSSYGLWRINSGCPWHFYEGEDLSDESTCFYVGVNDAIKTQHTYTDTYVTNGNDSDGYHDYAPYVFTLTITSQNTNVCPNIVIYWIFYVSDYCEGYDLSQLYKITNEETLAKYGLEADDDAVLCKGQLTDDGYELTTKVSEHFDLGADIFTAGVGENNIASVKFDWAVEYTDVTPKCGEGITADSEDYSAGIDGAITVEYLARQMSYIQVLDNKEECPHNYWIVFVNPFVGAEAGTVDLADGAGTNEADVKTKLEVYEISTDNYEGQLVAYWGESTSSETDDEGTETTTTSTGWIVTDIAASYGLTAADITATYAVDEENGDYSFLKSYVENNEDKELSVSEDGVVTWLNGGTKLQHSYTIYVNVTVTLDGIGTVECVATVILNNGYPAYDGSEAEVSTANFVL